MSYTDFVGAGKAEGLAICRIENFQPVSVNEECFGQSTLAIHTSFCHRRPPLCTYCNLIGSCREDPLRTEIVPPATMILPRKMYTLPNHSRLYKSCSGLAHDIYIWLGKETSLDECSAAAILAVQLDDSLGGLPVEHREEQGHESPDFVALFKSIGGIIVKDGGVASGFHHVEAEVYSPALLQVKGKRSVVTRQVPLKASSLNQGDSFVLDLGFDLLLWSESSSNTVEKAKAVEVMTRLHNSRRATTRRVVYADASEDEKKAFWAALGGSEADVRPAVADDESGTAATVPAAKLYRVSDAFTGNVAVDEIPRQDGRYNKEQLPKGDVALLDTGSDVFVWVSKTASTAERADGLRIAEEFIHSSARVADCCHVTIVREGGETPLFKAAFYAWDPVPSFDFSRRVSSGVAGPVAQADIDYTALAKGAGAGPVPFIPAGGSVKQWRVQGTTVSLVEPDSVGNFLAGDSYVVQYDYKDASGQAGTVMFFWLGRHSDSVERGTAALTARDMTDAIAKTAGGKNAHVSQVRVVQGSEPAYFTALFGGLMTVHAGGAKGLLQSKDAHLYHIKGSSQADTKAFEIEAKAANLNSGDCFVLIVLSSSTAFVWKGKGANEAEQETAAKLSTKLLGQWPSAGLKAVRIAEGSVPEAFWAALEGKAAYPEAIPPPRQQKPRLLVVSDASGALVVDEVYSYGQGDLQDDDVMLLDAGNAVHVWVGKGASAREQAEAVAIAEKYVAGGVKAGTHDANVPVARIDSGSEPSYFTALFPGWDAVATTVLEDPYAAKLAELKRDKERDRAGVEAAAAARAAKYAAAAAAAEAQAGVKQASSHESSGTAVMTAAAGQLKHAGSAKVATDLAGGMATPGAAPEVTGPLSGITVIYGGATYPIELLKAVTPAQPGPFAGLSFTDKESVLCEADFKALLGLDKLSYKALPKWKRQDIKKKAGLF